MNRPPAPPPTPAAAVPTEGAAVPIRVEPCGDAWVMIDWGPHARANVAARALAARLRAQPQPFCAEAVAGVRTLAVRLAVDPTAASRGRQRAAALDWLRGTAPEALGWQAPAGGQVVLPACYHPSMAPDLDEVAAATGLGTAEVVAIHSGCTFTAEVVGFMPGFAYLGGLDPRLRVDRRASPRARVPEGGIAIAGLQTAVYPSPTPGGWSLIGRCPLRLFDPARTPPALMDEGDTLRFEPIDVATFERLWATR
jgi:KipI family sensor histidine kinase inhibitor